MSVRVEVLAEINQRQVQREVDRMVATLDEGGQRAGQNFGQSLTTGIADVAPKVERSLAAVKKATDDLEKSENALSVASAARVDATNRAIIANNNYIKTKQDEKTTDEQLFVAMSRNLAALTAESKAKEGERAASVARVQAYQRESDLRRAATRELKSYGQGIEDAVDRHKRLNSELLQANSLGSKVAEGLTKITNALVPGSGVGPIALPIVDALIQLVPVAASAAQSVLVLPAVLGAAGVAFGSLALATNGFGDALKNMGDPEKFAEALGKLSPNAQQAALSIKNLMPYFNQLQQATGNAFFDGFGQQVNQLSNAYLPEVQRTTTGVAGAFNTMLTNISTELQTGSTQAGINTFLDNTVIAFQNLGPAAAPFTNAISTLLSVGSTELPKMTAGLTELANRFSNFVNNANATGDLQRWMEAGLNTLHELGGAAEHFVERFLQLAPVGEKMLPDIISGLNKTVDFIAEIVTLSSNTGSVWGTISDTLNDINPILQTINAAFYGLNKLTDGFADKLAGVTGIISTISEIVNGIKWFFDPNERNDATRDAVAKMNAAQIAAGARPTTVTMPDQLTGDQTTFGPTQGHTGSGPGFGGLGIPGVPGGGFGLPAGVRATMLGQSFGAQAQLADDATNPWFGGKPAGLSGGGSGSGSAKARRDAAGMALDPSLYSVGPQDAAGAYPGQYQENLIEQQHTIEEKKHALEEARKDRIVLERDNTASAQEIEDARYKEQKAQWDYQKSQQDLVEKSRKTTQDLSKGMDQLGAALDPDFGLSKGLAGLAENFVKFLGNIAAAPFFAEQQAKINADPIKGGYGLLGIRGAQNMSAGLSPLFGNPMPVGGGSYGYGASGGGYSGSGYMGDAALLSQIPQSGRYSQAGNRDLLKGFTDCSSAIGDLVTILDSGTTSPNKMSTGNAASWLTEHGFLPGKGGPGDFRVGYNSGHMQATLPDGTPVNYGNPNGFTNAGIGSAGAADWSFNQHYYRPTNGGGMAGGPVGMTTGGPTAPSAYTTPAGFVGMSTGGNGEISGGDSMNETAWIVGNNEHPFISGADPSKMSGPKIGSGGLFQPNAPLDNSLTSQSKEPEKPWYDSMIHLPKFGITGGDDSLNIGSGQRPHWKNPNDPRWWAPTPPTAPGLNVGGRVSGPPSIGAGQGVLSDGPLIMGAGQGHLSQTGGGGLLSNGPPIMGPGQGVLGNSGGQPPAGGTPAATTRYGGVSPTNNQGGGPGIGITPGGSLDSALNIAASAFPGVGQAAQTGVKLASRAIQYGGQVAGIATQGLMDTFLPTGGSELASNSWFTRILGGLSGATPAIPNTAGQPGGQDSAKAPPPLTPEQALAQHTSGGPGTPGPGNNITINTNQPAQGEQLGQTVAWHNQQQATMPGRP